MGLFTMRITADCVVVLIGVLSILTKSPRRFTCSGWRKTCATRDLANTVVVGSIGNLP